MIDTYEKCSCGARYKYKCSKESDSGYGKMCVREFKEQGITVMDAQQAFEMIENPVEANEKLIELLRLE
jgi:hypothetical protein